MGKVRYNIVGLQLFTLSCKHWDCFLALCLRMCLSVCPSVCPADSCWSLRQARLSRVH